MKRLLVLFAVATLLTSTTGCWRYQTGYRGAPCFSGQPNTTYFAPQPCAPCCESGCCNTGSSYESAPVIPGNVIIPSAPPMVMPGPGTGG